MIKYFNKNPKTVDVLVLIVGHKNPDFLADTAESFVHHHSTSSASYQLAFAIDNNKDCAAYLADQYGLQWVYNSSSSNGWGRGILRTIAYSLDQFHRHGLRWNHLITIDSDTLIVGPCLDQYLELIDENTCFVGQKWGGPPPYSSINPGPDHRSQRQIRQLAKLGLIDEKRWQLVDYMVAGPFVLWTKKTLDFMRQIELLPGLVLDKVYPYILFPHDQLSTFVLGMEGHEFKEIGPLSMLHCGDVGGDSAWKQGLPSWKTEMYGEIPLFPSAVSVIHPIRSKKFEEGHVRAFFKTLRAGNPEKNVDVTVWTVQQKVRIFK